MILYKNEIARKGIGRNKSMVKIDIQEGND